MLIFGLFPLKPFFGAPFNLGFSFGNRLDAVFATGDLIGQVHAVGYIKALLERDVRDLGEINRLNDMPRLLAVLAQLSGQLVNFALIGGQLGMNSKTAQKYLGVL